MGFWATQLPKNWAVAHDAPNGSGLSRLMLMMLGLWGDKVARASRLMLMMQLPKNWAVAHDAPKGSGLSRLMLMILVLWGGIGCWDFSADAHDAWALGRSCPKTGPSPMMLRKARGCPG